MARPPDLRIDDLADFALDRTERRRSLAFYVERSDVALEEGDA